MGNKSASRDSYKEMPTHKYINYVVQKNLNLWEKALNDRNSLSDKDSITNIKQAPRKTFQKPNIFFRFFCCLEKFDYDSEEVFSLFPKY